MVDKCYQKVIGGSAINLYVAGRRASLCRMDIKSGREREIDRYSNVSPMEAVAIASARFGHMAEVDVSGDSPSVRRQANRQVRSSRRRFSMEERLRLINERLDEEDEDL